ncbi:MAG: YitT family protein [Anaerolineae bacterium]
MQHSDPPPLTAPASITEADKTTASVDQVSTSPGPIKASKKRRMWGEIQRYFVVLVGVILAALGYSLFQVPYNIAAGGIGGLSIIINHFTGWPVGTLYLIMNVPLLILGYFHLGRWPFVIRTILAVIIFSIATDLFVAYLPAMLGNHPLTKDILLNAIYAGLVGGVGGGLVYQAGGTIGGTGIIGRIIQQKTGAPLSQVYLYTDGVIILTAGAVFGWEIALYALLTLVLAGMASDYTLEGPSSVRTATIITNQPDALAHALIAGLGRGVSQWPITGGYTGQTHAMLICTIYRPQVNDLKQIVSQVDPTAFVTIGVAHQAFGRGFHPLKRTFDFLYLDPMRNEARRRLDPRLLASFSGFVTVACRRLRQLLSPAHVFF